MKVTNMTSNKGNKVANQFIVKGIYIEIPDPERPDSDIAKIEAHGEMFQSYNSNIAFITEHGETYLDKKYWDYSVTTGKYRNEFLGEGITETRKKIESGEYVLVDLNN